MIIIKTISDMKKWSRETKGQIGFVPTMGYLHEGHLSLVRKSRTACDYTVASIFINPKQFGANEDLSTYPVDLESDSAKLAALGVDVLFLPQRDEIYPDGYKTYVNVEEITEQLCGKSRPALFRGVTTVVIKLFNIVRPHTAFFGEKDWQQLNVIRTMVRDLNMDVIIEGLPTARETDGLARSSRNVYLSESERNSARCLSQSLEAAKKLVSEGEFSAARIRDKVRNVIEEQDHTAIDYIAICNPETFVEQTAVTGKTLVALAVWIGKARLIDNCLLERN